MGKQKNIPKLRFPEFEGEYEKRILIDTCTIVGGGTPDSGKEELWNGHIQWFTPTEIKMDYVSKSERTITELGLKKSSARLLPKGTILLTSRATIGEVAIALNECTTNQGFQSLIVNKSFNSIFIFNWIKNNRNLFIRRANGSTFLEISKSEIGTIPIYAPTLPEQQKIASFFTAIDQKISQLKRKKILLEQYKKGVMQKIFSQEIRFKDDNGQEFPKWEKKRLSEIFIEINETVGTRDIPTYSITAGVGFVSQNEKFGRNISGQQNKHYTVINEGQFSYNKGNSKTYTYGCIYVNDTGKRIAVPNVFISFEFIDQKMSSQFYSKLFESHYLDKGLRKIISSSARMDGLLNVNKNSFFQLSVPCPNYIEQQKISHILNSIDSKIFNIKKQIEREEVWKKGLMQQMFV